MKNSLEVFYKYMLKGHANLTPTEVQAIFNIIVRAAPLHPVLHMDIIEGIFVNRVEENSNSAAIKASVLFDIIIGKESFRAIPVLKADAWLLMMSDCRHATQKLIELLNFPSYYPANKLVAILSKRHLDEEHLLQLVRMEKFPESQGHESAKQILRAGGSDHNVLAQIKRLRGNINS